MGGCGCGDNMISGGRGSDSLSTPEFFELLEKGRRRALEMMRHNPAARERVEKEFGLDYTKRRYPELYGINRAPVYDEPSDKPPVPFSL